MPQRKAYKCLNKKCPVADDLFNGFYAMNAPTPVCPRCGSIKLQEIEMPNIMASGSDRREDAKHVDSTMRRIAERYKLTNMSNKDGKPVKVPRESSGPKTKFNGIDVPMVGDRGACVNVPSMAQKLTGTWSGPGAPSNGKPALSQMTKVVAEHKG